MSTPNILDKIRIETSPETGTIYLCKIGAVPGKVFAKRPCEGEIIIALITCMLHGLEPGQGASHELAINGDWFRLVVQPIDGPTDDSPSLIGSV